MNTSPFDPSGRGFRGARRRGLPATALAAIAVTPALLVSAWIFFRSGDDDLPPAPPAAAGTAADGAATATDGVAAALAPAGGEGSARGATTGATPQPAVPAEPTPMALGIPAPEISASAAIVVDDASLAVLLDRNAFERRPPASVTKIATAIVALEHRRLDEEVVAPVHYWDLALSGDSSTMGLETGDVLTLRDMLYGLMLVSGNDAAIAIAEHVAGGEQQFVREMNELALRLGLQDTHFTNASGLYAPDHYSSAWDLALLSRYLMRFPDLRQIVGTEEITVTGTRDGAEVEYDLYNHNPLLNYTPGVDGGKTGFTEEAGRTFTVTAERDGHRVYVVLLDTSLRAQDAIALIEWAFENHRWPGQETPGPTGSATP